MQNRWYDADPTICLAMNLFRNLKPEQQGACAEYIINLAQECGIELRDDIKTNFNYFWRRWYDSNEKVFESLQYFKEADFEIQKQLSLEIINYIRELEKN